MAGKATPHTRNLAVGKGQGLLMSPTQGQADIIGATLAPAISKHLTAFLYGWLPLSDASGIYPCLCIPFVMLPLFPRALPWAGGSLPLSGAHSAVRLGDCDTTEGMPWVLDYMFCCNGVKYSRC